MDILDIQFLSSLLSIIMIDIILGGDNAIVIALATRRLPKEQRKKAVFWGVFGAIAIRAALTAIAVYVLKIPLIKLIGGVLLVWIGYKLLVDEDQHEGIKSGHSIRQAVQTIIVADLLMGVDNVLAVAGAAHGSTLLVFLGLLISIPIIVWGSSIILHLIEKFKAIIFIGAGVIAWTAGRMIVEDDLVHETIILKLPILEFIIPILSVGLVIILGYVKRKQQAVYHRL